MLKDNFLTDYDITTKKNNVTRKLKNIIFITFQTLQI